MRKGVTNARRPRKYINQKYCAVERRPVMGKKITKKEIKHYILSKYS